MSTMMTQGSFEDVNAEYAAFVEKFKPKKTTDDCYTPKNIYEAVADWAAEKYGFDKRDIVRPFWPGGDYERFDYPQGCVVVDNPPFSILSKILRMYTREGIRFFLFAPALSAFSCFRIKGVNVVTACATVTYENGAKVPTSFMTNMGEYIVETAPELSEKIEAINEQNVKKNKKKLPKYRYPDAVITSASCSYLSKHGVDFRVRREDALFVVSIDAMNDRGIFGGGLLLTERAAAERAAAERAAAEGDAEIVFELSPREKEMQRMLANNKETERCTGS